jgi:hypothetical protein
MRFDDALRNRQAQAGAATERTIAGDAARARSVAAIEPIEYAR